MLSFKSGIPIIQPNEVIDSGSEHWYISYNPSARDYGCKTTALVLWDGEYFIILNGDHRAGFKKAIESTHNCFTTRLSRCLDYVREHKDQLSKFSEPLL